MATIGHLQYDLNTPVEGFAPSHVRVNSESIQIAVGPPVLSDFSEVDPTKEASANFQMVYPLGLTQAFSMPQQKQILSLSEIGSRRNFMVPGKSIATLALSKTWIYGPNLLKALYAWYDLGLYGEAMIPTRPKEKSLRQLSIAPGFEAVYMNLESDLFDHPFGLLLVIRDTNGEYMYASYFESCYIQGHNIAPRSDGMVMMENVSILPERQVPVQVSGVKLKDALQEIRRGDTGGFAKVPDTQS